MSFGSSQGTVRYALMVDDAQANQAITRVKSGFTSLAAPTNALSQNMGKLNQQFTAGVNPIKAQGNALTTLNTNLKATNTTSTTLGTKIKSTAGQFAGFATGLAATSSGVLQLAAGFRDYNDAQIAVDRVTRKNSLAQEALGKAQDKLKKITDTGVKSGKAYEAALLDVNQAQQMASIQSDLLGEAQERLFDSQTQFVSSVVPTVLGAVGTMGFAFKELGLKSSSLTGIFSKLGGVFSGVIPSLTGIGTKAPLAALGMTAMGGAGTVGATGLKGFALSAVAASGGIAGMIALAGPIAALIKTILVVKDIGPKIWENVMPTTDQLTRLKNSKDILAGLKDLPLTGGQIDLLDRFTGMSKEVDKLTKSVQGAVKPSQELTDAQNKLNAAMKDPALRSHVTDTANAAKATLAHAQAEVDRLKALEKTNVTLGKSNTLSQEELNILGRANEAKQQQIDWQIKLAGAYEEVMLKTKASADDSKRQVEAVKELDTALNKTIPSFLKFADAGAKSAEATKLVGDMVKLTKDRMIEWNPAAGASADIMSTIDDVLAGLPAKQASWTNSITANSKALEDAKKKLEEFQKKVAEGVKAVGVTFKVKDNVDKFMKEIKKNLPDKIEKKIDMKLDFRGNVKDATTAFNSWLETATTMDESTADGIVKGIIKTIDEKFKGKKGAFAGLRAQLQAEMKDPNTVQILKNNIANGDYTAAGKKVGTGIMSGIEAITNAGGGLASLWEGAGGKGIVIPAPVIPAPVTTAFDTGVKTLTTNVANITKTVPVLSLNNTNAIKAVDVIAKRIMSLTGLSPIISLVNKQAIKAVDVIAKRIDSLTGIKPQISLQNKQAIKSVDVVAKRIDSLSKIKPFISLSNSQAIKAVDVVAKRINGLSNINATVHVGLSGPGASLASKGDTSIPSKGDTSGIFVGGSKSNSSGGGGGDTILNVNIMDETIMRKITARSGRNRFTLGV